jgi:hypothetical protein
MEFEWEEVSGLVGFWGCCSIFGGLSRGLEWEDLGNLPQNSLTLAAEGWDGGSSSILSLRRVPKKPSTPYGGFGRGLESKRPRGPGIRKFWMGFEWLPC